MAKLRLDCKIFENFGMSNLFVLKRIIYAQLFLIFWFKKYFSLSKDFPLQKMMPQNWKKYLFSLEIRENNKTDFHEDEIFHKILIT